MMWARVLLMMFLAPECRPRVSQNTLDYMYEDDDGEGNVDFYEQDDESITVITENRIDSLILIKTWAENAMYKQAVMTMPMLPTTSGIEIHTRISRYAMEKKRPFNTRDAKFIESVPGVRTITGYYRKIYSYPNRADFYEYLGESTEKGRQEPSNILETNEVLLQYGTTNLNLVTRTSRMNKYGNSAQSSQHSLRYTNSWKHVNPEISTGRRVTTLGPLVADIPNNDLLTTSTFKAVTRTLDAQKIHNIKVAIRNMYTTRKVTRTSDSPAASPSSELYRSLKKPSFRQSPITTETKATLPDYSGPDTTTDDNNYSETKDESTTYMENTTTDTITTAKEELISVPTCPTPTTTQTPTTMPRNYDFTNSSTVAKCFVCGLDKEGIPQDAYCSDAFASEFISLMPVNTLAKSQLASYKKHCRYLDVRGYVNNPEEPRATYGRFSGGCSVRWIDLSGVYTQRTCRSRRRAIMGKHFTSKRMAKLEMALNDVDEGCIISPMATLVPLSRGVSLYARFHACVCTGAWCNRTVRNKAWTLNNLILFWYFKFR